MINREDVQKLSREEKKKLFNYLISEFISEIADSEPAKAREAKHTFLNYVMFFKNVESLLQAASPSSIKTLQALAAKLSQNL
jgi:hypothetical protein